MTKTENEIHFLNQEAVPHRQENLSQAELPLQFTMEYLQCGNAKIMAVEQGIQDFSEKEFRRETDLETNTLS